MNNETNTGYQQACGVLNRLSDEEVEMTWKAINDSQRSEEGLSEDMLYNGVSLETWIDLVYSELGKRRNKSVL